MGKFPCCLSILLGHSAYESIKWAWDCSLAPRPTGTGYVTFTLLNSHAFWIRVATGIIPCRDYPWLILVPKPRLGIRKAVRFYQVKIMSRSFPISRDLPWPPAGPFFRGEFLSKLKKDNFPQSQFSYTGGSNSSCSDIITWFLLSH